MHGLRKRTFSFQTHIDGLFASWEADTGKARGDEKVGDEQRHCLELTVKDSVAACCPPLCSSVKSGPINSDEKSAIGPLRGSIPRSNLSLEAEPL